jgi:lipopolysaccharide transport system ATP-binding protein
MSEVLIHVDHASKRFCRDLKRSLLYGVQDSLSDLIGRRNGNPILRSGEFWALDDVSFEVRRGECLGLIGRNGAGKTTLLKMLNGLIKPDKGRIEMRGRVAALIALGAGFNPILTGRENIYVNGSVLGLSKKEIGQKLEDIIEFADIGEFIDSPVQTYSSGMQVRLGFAIATSLEPDVLLLDEVLAVGDIDFRAKCYERIGKIISRTAVILVSHNMAQIPRLCDKVLFLSKGGASVLPVAEGINAYIQTAGDATFETRRPPLILAPGLRSAQLAMTPTELVSFGKATIRVEVHTEQAYDIGLIVGNFVTPDGREGAEFRLSPLPGVNAFHLGRTDLEIEIASLPFSSGKYLLNLAIFDSTRKVPLVHFINGSEVTVVGQHIASFPNLLKASDARETRH